MDSVWLVQKPPVTQWTFRFGKLASLFSKAHGFGAFSFFIYLQAPERSVPPPFLALPCVSLSQLCVCMSVCICADHTGDVTESITLWSREVSVVTDFEDRQFVAVHLKCQVHENRDFRLFCILLRPSTWKSAGLPVHVQ